MGARAKTGLSQTEFAKMIGVSTRTLQGWEQGRKKDADNKVLIETIKRLAS